MLLLLSGITLCSHVSIPAVYWHSPRRKFATTSQHVQGSGCLLWLDSLATLLFVHSYWGAPRGQRSTWVLCFCPKDRHQNGCLRQLSLFLQLQSLFLCLVFHQTVSLLSHSAEPGSLEVHGENLLWRAELRHGMALESRALLDVCRDREIREWKGMGKAWNRNLSVSDSWVLGLKVRTSMSG